MANGDRTIQTTPIGFVAEVGPHSAAGGDFNGDGLPNLAVADLDPNGGVLISFNEGKWAP